MPDALSGPPDGLAELRFNPQLLARVGLPDILYPVAQAALEAALGDDGELPYADMLYGLQLRAREGKTDWKALEPALDRLAELIAPDDARDVIAAGGGTWWIEIGPVDLGAEIVTIQREQVLIAAICQSDDGRLRVVGYRPLDARSANCLIQLGMRPHPEHGVCMRATNWDYALDCSAGTGNFYAFERGEAHLSWWEHGIGLCRDGEVDPHWRAMLDLAPRRPAMLAIELGVHYSMRDQD